MGSRPDEVERRDRPQSPDAPKRAEPVYRSENKNPDEIRHDIAKTRAEMSETIDVIQDKLSPQRLRSQAGEAVREATIGRAKEMADRVSYQAKRAGSGIVDTVRANPIPSALVALGLTWLFMERRSSSRMVNRPMESRYYVGEGEERSRIQEMASDVQARTGEAVSHVQERAGETLSRVQERAGETVSRVQERAGEVASQAQERIQDLGYQAQEQFQQAKSRFSQLLEENPFAVGAAALALGAIVGLSIPRTRQEDRLMGGMRDDLMERAQHTAEETMEKAQQVAKEAGRAAKDAAQQEAKDQGLEVGRS